MSSRPADSDRASASSRSASGAPPPVSQTSGLLAWQARIFSLLWIAYASYYLCRLNFSVAQPSIMKDFPDWTQARIGWIPSVYAGVYAIGQFVNGQLAVRLGGSETLMSHPASTTHSGVSKQTRDRLGITDALIRISVGIEDADDLIADLGAALDAV